MMENLTGCDDIQKQLPEVFCKKKGVLKNFANLTGKY